MYGHHDLVWSTAPDFHKFSDLVHSIYYYYYFVLFRTLCAPHRNLFVIYGVNALKDQNGYNFFVFTQLPLKFGETIDPKIDC